MICFGVSTDGVAPNKDVAGGGTVGSSAVGSGTARRGAAVGRGAAGVGAADDEIGNDVENGVRADAGLEADAEIVGVVDDVVAEDGGVVVVVVSPGEEFT